MKTFIILVAACLFTVSTSHAETLTPQSTVRLLIESVQNNDLQKVVDSADLVSIANHPRHGRSPRNLVAFLKTIDLKKLKFQQIKIGPLPKKTTVRIIAPISYDFDLVLCTATEERQEDWYEVVAVHP